MKTLLRSAGIWISDGQILLESLKDRDVWGIPGGFVEEGESVEQACLREYLEETGVEVQCTRLAIIHEQFWIYKGQPVREYGFYFEVHPVTNTGSPPQVKSIEEHLKIEWHPLSNLGRIDFVPVALQPYITDLSGDTLFISSKEYDK